MERSLQNKLTLLKKLNLKIIAKVQEFNMTWEISHNKTH